MSRTRRTDLTLDLVGAYRGPCGLCGCLDARHRIFDAIRSRNRAGDDVGMIADDHGYAEWQVQAIIDAPEWRVAWPKR